MRILFVASEAVPWAKTGGLADVLGALPRSIRRLGPEVSVVLPKYRGIKARRRRTPSLTIPLGDQLRFCPVYEAESHCVRFFFVDYPPYYDREGLYQAGPARSPGQRRTFCSVVPGRFGVCQALSLPA